MRKYPLCIQAPTVIDRIDLVSNDGVKRFNLPKQVKLTANRYYAVSTEDNNVSIASISHAEAKKLYIGTEGKYIRVKPIHDGVQKVHLRCEKR